MKVYASQRGQIGIVLLLISVVMLTVGISVATRSSSDINISTSGEAANRAFDAAESEIERTLADIVAGRAPNVAPNTTTMSSPMPVNGASVVTSISRPNVLETSVEHGQVVGVNTVGATSVVTINWAKETDPAKRASLAISVFSSANTNLRRFYFAPQGNTHTTDGFANSTAGTVTGYSSRAVVPLAPGDQLIRIRPVYAGTDVHVSGVNFPIQEYVVRAVATDPVSSETKAVEVERTLPMAPSVFDYVLYSGTSITP